VPVEYADTPAAPLDARQVAVVSRPSGRGGTPMSGWGLALGGAICAALIVGAIAVRLNATGHRGPVI
jgi:hypothetical protein